MLHIGYMFVIRLHVTGKTTILLVDICAYIIRLQVTDYMLQVTCKTN